MADALNNPAHRLVLASKSASRAAVLRGAGLTFEQITAGVDEESIKASLRVEGASCAKQADILAETKALKVSISHHGVILGADQMLDLEGEAFDKPADREEAREHLKKLRGKTHILQTALVACVEGVAVWRHLAQPRLRMRNFSDEFLEAYLDQTVPDILTSVGGYQLEGRGAQLFERIEGDYFSILGLPLLPLLQWLRDRGTIPA
ncbi:MAG TPA: nucleoside triphosphate pyrophosphatase [Hyphomonadaceae bacterium]|jgi:septum formation protein|nr:nucleoside triphosphate pyrophosphatase [Hyphomonadaceae bacterium]